MFWQDNLRQRIVQDIIGIVVKSDRDNDQTIDKSEAKTLALRIRMSLQEYGVVFDADKFLKAIGDDATVPGVIAVVQKLLPAEKKRGDGDDTSDTDSDSESDDEDDVYDMFYMAEDTVQGSLARSSTVEGGGCRPVSLMKCDKQKSSRSKRGLLKRPSSGSGRKRLSTTKKKRNYSDDSDDSDSGSY